LPHLRKQETADYFSNLTFRHRARIYFFWGVSILGKSIDELEKEIETARRNFIAWKRHFEKLSRDRQQLEEERARSKPRGRKGGRKPALTPEQIEQAKELVYSHSLEKIAHKFKVSVRTLERYNIRAPQSVCNL